MAKKKNEIKTERRANYYINLVVFAVVICAEAVMLALLNVPQPLVGYTLIIITTIVAGLNLKPSSAVILGVIAGIVSLVCGFPADVFAGPMIYKVLIAVLPKIAICWLCSFIYTKLSGIIPPLLLSVLCVVLGLVVNACVCALIMLTASLFKDISGKMDLGATIKRIFGSLLDFARALKNVLIP